MTFKPKSKKIFNINHNDVNKILVSKKEKYGKYNSFKYFIGYNDDVIKPLYFELSLVILINLMKIKTKTKIKIFLKVKDKKRFKNYNKIQKKLKS